MRWCGTWKVDMIDADAAGGGAQPEARGQCMVYPVMTADGFFRFRPHKSAEWGLAPTELDPLHSSCPMRGGRGMCVC